MRTILLEGGVPEMRTGRAEKPIPPASDPSTWSGRLWTGERRCVFPPNPGDYSAVPASQLIRRRLAGPEVVVGVLGDAVPQHAARAERRLRFVDLLELR